jgi:hypothetical protein
VRSAPAPNLGEMPRYPGERTLEIVRSKTGRYRAIITADAGGRLRVHIQEWDIRDWDLAGVAHWTNRERTAMFADTLERALELGREELRQTGDEAAEDAVQQ